MPGGIRSVFIVRARHEQALSRKVGVDDLRGAWSDGLEYGVLAVTRYEDVEYAFELRHSYVSPSNTTLAELEFHSRVD